MRSIQIDSLQALDELLKPNEEAVYLLDEEQNQVAVLTSYKYYWQIQAELRILTHLFDPKSEDIHVDELFDKHHEYEKVVSVLGQELLEQDEAQANKANQ
ncbi:hypothetical protein F7U66_00115 [Vibrio parahaemolyticus]|nr:hypothetical protein [Vibrio parahaemolyticus]